MIGHITNQSTADAITAAIENAQTSRGVPVYWLLVGVPIYSGEHAGKVFFPTDDEALNTPLRGNPVQTPQDFPEFQQLVDILGGLEARVNLSATDIIPLQS
jgi:hypothetical protein